MNENTIVLDSTNPRNNTWQALVTVLLITVLVVAGILWAFPEPEGAPIDFRGHNWGLIHTVAVDADTITRETNLVEYGVVLSGDSQCVPAYTQLESRETWCFTGFGGAWSVDGRHGKFLAWTNRQFEAMVLIDQELPVELWNSTGGSAAKQEQLAELVHRTDGTLFIDWWPISEQEFDSLKKAGIPELRDLP